MWSYDGSLNSQFYLKRLDLGKLEWIKIQNQHLSLKILNRTEFAFDDTLLQIVMWRCCSHRFFPMWLGKLFWEIENVCNMKIWEDYSRGKSRIQLGQWTIQARSRLNPQWSFGKFSSFHDLFSMLLFASVWFYNPVWKWRSQENPPRRITWKTWEGAPPSPHFHIFVTRLSRTRLIKLHVSLLCTRPFFSELYSRLWT